LSAIATAASQNVETIIRVDGEERLWAEGGLNESLVVTAVAANRPCSMPPSQKRLAPTSTA
jgi:hypothetical protein